HQARSGAGTTTAAGQLKIPGSASMPGWAAGGGALVDVPQVPSGTVMNSRMSFGGNGGGSHLGGASAGGKSGGPNDSTVGVSSALGYGSGAPAPASASGSGTGGGTPSAAVPGRDGAPGVVIVEVYMLTVTAA